MKSLLSLFGLSLLASSIVAPSHAMTLEQAIKNPARSTENITRDAYRHPLETLTFFEVDASKTVVEISPGGGWYTEILAPMLSEQGKYYAAHFPKNTDVAYYKKNRDAFEQRVANTPAFSKTIITEFDAATVSTVAPANSADVVLTFRNIHNWYMGQNDQGINNAFTSFYNALKPGGILGVVEHRLPESRDNADQTSSGYMKQSYVIEQAKKAGFELVQSSEINANSKDTADHPKGVWTLPPRLALGEQESAKYVAIGESDRMTLKFRKPLKQ